jgi:hypothetical protein
MEKPLFLYIDDENDDSVKAIIDGFMDVQQINIELFPIEANRNFDAIKKLLSELKYDGLIIDLKLDGDGPNRVNFRAPTLAQDIRTLNSSGDLKNSVPLILCSTEQKMRATYDSDKTSHDLFDYKFLKGSEPNWPKFSSKLLSLANGYKWLNEKKRSIIDVLGREDLTKIDNRITDKFWGDNWHPNEITYFVIKDLFHHPGPLIKESVLASRLGIDINASGESWKSLLESFFKGTQFNGLFHEGWSRWWADQVITTFRDLSAGKRLSTLNSDQRVEILQKVTGIGGLKAAAPIQYCNSRNFWTICEGYKTPLDPLEGFRVFETTDIKPWQENKFLSFNAIVSREFESKGLRPHPSENERIQSLKESLSKK